MTDQADQRLDPRAPEDRPRCPATSVIIHNGEPVMTLPCMRHEGHDVKPEDYLEELFGMAGTPHRFVLQWTDDDV